MTIRVVLLEGKTGCDELYVYQAVSGRLACASCPSGLPTSNVTSIIPSRLAGVPASGHQSHALSDDGRRVFFTTGDRLVAEDTNGRLDAYEYDTSSGKVALISSGKSTTDAAFADASANGDDVFFATREQLVGWDFDSSYDLYDARVGGGLPEPKTSVSCDLSACQGPLVGAPAAVGGATAGYVGSGNVHERLRHRSRAKRCKRGKVRRKVNGKARCVRRGKGAKARHKRDRSASHTSTRRSAR